MYYSIDNKTDKEVGNVFPQVGCSNQILAHSIRYDKFSDFDSDIIFELEPKAKLTDVLSQSSISAHGLLINEKVKTIFEECQLMSHKYYNCTVKDKKGEFHKYFWIHLVDDFNTKIDYTKSKFYWTKSTFRKGAIKLTSYEDYLSKKKQNGILWGVDIDKIALDDSLNEFDLFSCLPFDLGIYASDKLKSKLEVVTGILIDKSLKFI